MFLMFWGGIDMAAIPDSRSRVEWFSRDVIGWKQKAPWISLFPASCFIPCLSSPPPDLIFHPYCALLVLWTQCCPLQENHMCHCCCWRLSWRRWWRKAASLARLIQSTVLQSHLHPESLKAPMREDLGFQLL